jgi:hypothetical protein
VAFLFSGQTVKLACKGWNGKRKTPEGTYFSLLVPPIGIGEAIPAYPRNTTKPRLLLEK